MNADVLICSHPRSGGRWLRYLVAHYLAARHELETAVTPSSVFGVIPDHHEESTRGYPAFRFTGTRGLPLVAVCHQPYGWELHRAYPIVFLARNAYDVVVSGYHHLTQQKGEYAGSMREFIEHPKWGLPGWIAYMNTWSPRLLTHRDAATVSYGELVRDPAAALEKVLHFLDQEAEPEFVGAAVASANALRNERKIRTGQEGNFWDHLQPEEIFDVQERLQKELSDFSVHLLRSAGVEVDPFPRAE